ncbi:hypothetical protein NMY22_g18527 [Coprinellus aureogranulatus]|nr:hypothetical protein NMY22_g18527 [Coprinellus aureogranulatus]
MAQAEFPGVRLPPENSLTMPCLKRLVCDYPSLYEGVVFWLKEGPSIPCNAMLSRLESLDITIATGEESNEPYEFLLRRTESLRELTLTVLDDATDAPTLSQPANGIEFTPPLQCINPSSWTTLVHLSYNVLIDLALDLERPGSAILHDPYLGLCHTPLSKFTSLEYLQVTIRLDGRLDTDNAQRAFGSQWGALPEALAVPGAFSSMKRIAIAIHLQADSGYDQAELHQAAGTDSAFFAGRLILSVKPQFFVVEELCEVRKIKFSFVVY